MFCNGKRTTANHTAKPEKYPQKRFNDKMCRWCDEFFTPLAPSHLYCSDFCSRSAFSNKRLIRDYGITLDQYEELLGQQNSLCAICGEEGFSMHKHREDTVKLVVDHDHRTNHVRGLLCHNCNRALGLFKDGIYNLKKAIDYLEGATTIRKE